MGFYYVMCYIYCMLEKNIKPIDQYQVPSMVVRLGAAALDLALYILLSFLLLTLGGLIVGREGTSFSNANATISDHIVYSKLAKTDEKNGYVAYQNNELLSLDNDNHSFILNNVAYFYCHYLTGEEIEDGLQASLDIDKQIKTKEGSFLPKDYYTITYINETILGLPKEGEIGHSKYFVYEQKDGENDYTKIGTFKEEFFEATVVDGKDAKRLKNTSEILEVINDIYHDAIKVFYNQQSIKKAQKVVDNTNAILMLISTLPCFAIFYLLLPLISPFGQTLGKRILSLGVVTEKGYLIKKWNLLLRIVPILGTTICICLVNSLYWQLLIPLFLLLISMGILVFNPRRRALHDLMAGTSVIKLEKNNVIYEDEAHYEKALEIMKERDQVENV